MAPEHMVTLTFGDGKTITLPYSEYQAQLQDPFVEVTLPGGSTQIMRQSQFHAMQNQRLDAYQGRMTAEIGQVYQAGRNLDDLSTEVLGIGSEVQAALSSVLGAFGTGQDAAKIKDIVQRAASTLDKGFGTLGKNISSMGDGLITSSGKLLEAEEANVASFGRTVTDPRPRINKIYAMGKRGE
jgi:hypothetical protein